MTPRDRWVALLNREPYDRVPLSYRATPEFTQALMKHLGVDTQREMLDRLHVDPVFTVGPRYIGPVLPGDTDVYGVRYQYTDYGLGKYRDPTYHPLAEYESAEEIENNYQWPEPDWWDYSVIPEQIEGHENEVIRGGSYEEFATFKDLRGVQQAYIDLVENPEIVHYCMQRLTDLRYEDAARIYEQIPGQVIWTWVAEDVAGQEGLFISLDDIRQFLLPHMQRMIDLVHENGAHAFHHSDGAPRANLPQMVEAGIDVLEPVQWRCAGMDRRALKEEFGGDIAFMGAMDNQYTLVNGTVEEIKQEVEDNIAILGEDGGYILGPCHNIQPVSDPAKIVALYDHAWDVGWY